jgi:hypothetical protein
VVWDLLNLSLPRLVDLDLLPPSGVWKSVATAAVPAEDETGDETGATVPGEGKGMDG